MEERISILLKPNTDEEEVLGAIKNQNLSFKFEKVIQMKKEGSVIIGACDEETQTLIKGLPNVDDIEKSGTVTIC